MIWAIGNGFRSLVIFGLGILVLDGDGVFGEVASAVAGGVVAAG